MQLVSYDHYSINLNIAYRFSSLFDVFSSIYRGKLDISTIFHDVILPLYSSVIRNKITAEYGIMTSIMEI